MFYAYRRKAIEAFREEQPRPIYASGFDPARTGAIDSVLPTSSLPICGRASDAPRVLAGFSPTGRSWS